MSNTIRKSMAALIALMMAFSIFAIVPTALAEGTDEVEVTDEVEEPAPEETEEPAPEETEEEPAPEETEEPAAEPTAAPVAAPSTGDGTANLAIAVAATAVVAAAGMGFILKKVR